MAKTVDEGFRVFLSWLTPTSGESNAAKNHRASIESCLKSNFEITRFFPTGSFGNATSISGYSDVDYFASIPYKHQRQNSSTMLQVVKDTLDGRFPNTGVMIRTPAVVLPFGTDRSESTEVVPAYWVENDKNNVYIYKIADGSGGWIKSAPDYHNGYVANVDNKLNKKVKPLIRFIKAWKYYCNVPVSSFYLELRVAAYASKEDSIIYDIDVKRVFDMLWDNKFAAMQDPMGVSGYISACKTDLQKQESLSKLLTACTRAEKAVDANHYIGKVEDAFYWWNLLYNDNFPAYY